MKKGDIMMVGADTGWGQSDMKKGDLVVVIALGGGEVGGVSGDYAALASAAATYAQVLHPTVGVCYISKHRLEAV